MSVETILLPFQFPFMQNAFLIALLVAPPTALLSCYLVLKGWALMGDAISHAILPGVVLAYLFGLPLIIGAFAAGMGCALLTGYLSNNSRVKQDTVMGVVFSGMFAVGLILFVAFPTDAHLDHILFGNMLGVGSADLWTTGSISFVVCAAILLKWKDLLLHAFDPAQAQASVSILLSCTMGSRGFVPRNCCDMSSVGLILAIALLVTPGAIAFLTTRSFGKMLVVSVAVCTLSMLLGVYLSFFLNSASAPTIVLVLTIIFICVFSVRWLLTSRRSKMHSELLPKQLRSQLDRGAVRNSTVLEETYGRTGSLHDRNQSGLLSPAFSIVIDKIFRTAYPPCSASCYCHP